MNVMLADIEAEALMGAVGALHGVGPGVRGVICDVADPACVDDAARVAYKAFGTVHVVCNNAGVGGGSGRTPFHPTLGDGCSTSTWRAFCTVSEPSCRTSALTARAATSSTRRPRPG
jgi:NAD(P)-dependent dehydrogenase (short-subunit alcohol dehydrogenase family)